MRRALGIWPFAGAAAGVMGLSGDGHSEGGVKGVSSGVSTIVGVYLAGGGALGIGLVEGVG